MRNRKLMASDIGKRLSNPSVYCLSLQNMDWDWFCNNSHLMFTSFLTVEATFLRIHTLAWTFCHERLLWVSMSWDCRIKPLRSLAVLWGWIIFLNYDFVPIRPLGLILFEFAWTWKKWLLDQGKKTWYSFYFEVLHFAADHQGVVSRNPTSWLWAQYVDLGSILHYSTKGDMLFQLEDKPWTKLLKIVEKYGKW